MKILKKSQHLFLFFLGDENEEIDIKPNCFGDNKIGFYVICYIIIQFLFLLTTRLNAQDYIEVVAKGSFPFSKTISKNELQKYALKDAYFKAIEKGVGVLINKTTSVKNYKDIVSISMTKSNGYIKSYDIIEEGIENDDKDYFVIIKAKVSEGSFIDNSDTQAHIIFNQVVLDSPKIIYFINKSTKVKTGLFAITSLLLEPFKTNGYTILAEEKEEFVNTIDSSLEKGIIPKDYILNSKTNGEILLLIKIDSDGGSRIETNSQLFSTRLSISYYLILLETGELLYTDSEQVPGLGISIEQSEYVALKKFEYNFANKITNTIPKLFSEFPLQIKLDIHNVNESSIFTVDSVLVNLPLLISAELQNFNKNDKKLEYKLLMDPISGGSNAVWRYCKGFFPERLNLLQLNKHYINFTLTN